MKNLHIRLITAVLIGATASIAAAQEMEHGSMGMMHGCMQGMQKMDANEDGEISKDEFVQAHEQMFAAMDKDGDGALDMKNGGMMMNCCDGASDESTPEAE